MKGEQPKVTTLVADNKSAIHSEGEIEHQDTFEIPHGQKCFS